MKVRPIGIIHTPYKIHVGTPGQSSQSKAVGTIEVYKKYEEGLSDLEGFSHIIVIFRFHKSRGYKLKLKPYWDTKQRGLFSTRAPRRPNQLGVSILKLLKRKGNTLTVKGVDMFDGTPLLDIKPYIPNNNPKHGVKIGWLARKKK
ncbi:MAG: tRNA (N6-threonylcarbamoyladenosine(37)-N6)-methyltransferase TrmO [candidate division WOR-3 bacterium]|jgi:tRNA-Thr(GGU) m(6)t(6)A37 methyltransferase TsaA